MSELYTVKGPVVPERPNILDVLCIEWKYCKFSVSAVPHSWWDDRNGTTFHYVSSGCERKTSLFLPAALASDLIPNPLFSSFPISSQKDCHLFLSQSSCNISACLAFQHPSCHSHDSLECFLSRNGIFILCFNTTSAFPLLEPLCLFSVNKLSFSLWEYFLWLWVCVCSAKTSEF